MAGNYYWIILLLLRNYWISYAAFFLHYWHQSFVSEVAASLCLLAPSVVSINFQLLPDWLHVTSNSISTLKTVTQMSKKYTGSTLLGSLILIYNNTPQLFIIVDLYFALTIYLIYKVMSKYSYQMLWSKKSDICLPNVVEWKYKAANKFK